MPEKYIEAIIKYLSDRDYQPMKVRQLARRMGVAEAQYNSFRDAVKQLRDEGRVVLGQKNSVALPAMTDRVVGVYRGSAKGFGFVVPDEPNAHGDLFIPPGAESDAITGDRVVAEVRKKGRRSGKSMFEGAVEQVLERGHSRFVGELVNTEGVWFVNPQGRAYTDPIVIEDVGPSAKAGLKVVVEIVQYPKGKELARGAIVETLGKPGAVDVETLGIIREHGLPDEFPDEVLTQARSALDRFDPDSDPGRVDLSGQTIVTIDPDDARDYDDAISLTRDGDQWRLGVHIADVSHFVTEASPLDEEARHRGNSSYFPRKVIPMLPEVLSNGVCSLQEGQIRFVKSAYIDYDAQGNVIGSDFANAKIRSAKRLTYTQAQAVIDGKTGGFAPEVVTLLRNMNELARIIRKRRVEQGMISLNLPEVELVLNDDGDVVDAAQADDSFTHTIIEMFMVEANEAVARLLDSKQVEFLRRIHPDRDEEGNRKLVEFVRACGLKLPKDVSRSDIQQLVKTTEGKPESYAVNLALLKTFERAEYSPMHVGHYALASTHYCHFTSPIRRYPDLTVHRLLDDYLRDRLIDPAEQDVSALTALGEHCSYTERRSQNAEDDLRKLLVLKLLATHVGEEFDGVVTGITSFGLFIQSSKYLVEGLVKLEDLGDDWWEVDVKRGTVTGQRSGRKLRLGDMVTARIVSVDLPRRQMDLMLVSEKSRKGRSGKGKGKGGGNKPKAKSSGDQKPKANGQKPKAKGRGTQGKGNSGGAQGKGNAGGAQGRGNSGGAQGKGKSRRRR